MDDNELREMDVKVQHALYPEWRIEKREWKRGIDYRAILPGDGPNTWLKDIPLPWYTTDIADWEPVYALKPGWMWRIKQAASCVWVSLTAGDVRITEAVNAGDATWLAAWALGMARCVIAWAEEKR